MKNLILKFEKEYINILKQIINKYEYQLNCIVSKYIHKEVNEKYNISISIITGSLFIDIDKFILKDKYNIGKNYYEKEYITLNFFEGYNKEFNESYFKNLIKEKLEILKISKKDIEEIIKLIISFYKELNDGEINYYEIIKRKFNLDYICKVYYLN